MRISVFGAGKSSFYLLKYLADRSAQKGWTLAVYDKDPGKVSSAILNIPVGLNSFDISTEDPTPIVAQSDIVVSLLPPALHLEIARICLEKGVHLATASYVSPELRELHDAAKAKGLIFINELGLDPGIDHLSAMKLISSLKSQGARIISFESFCGGLISKEDCAGNPWGYKFSWNPRNVVLAGQGGNSVFRRNGQLRYIPWHQLFAHAQTCYVPSIGSFDAYPNRDSLAYTASYGLEDIDTFFRGTLRRKHYCRCWQVLVSLGFTDTSSSLNANIRSAHDLASAFSGFPATGYTFAEWLLHERHIDEGMAPHFAFLGMENKEALPGIYDTAADMLQAILEDKWKLQPTDRDEIIMYHHFVYELQGQTHHLKSVLNLKGNDSFDTAMAKTVGLPLALGVELILEGRISERGVIVPLSPEWYEPILKGLEGFGVTFTEDVI